MPIKAGACCHPSIRLEGYTGGSPEELSTRIQCPMMFASAGNDPDNVKEGGDCSKTILEKFPTSDIKSYPEMEHGWVSRGDQSKENVARDVKAAIEQCDSFFKINL
jgi:dienelactone hydrolase